MKVIAIKEHQIDGARRYRIGDMYEVTEQSAQFLVKLGYVRLDSEPDDKKRYKRKDLRAES